MSTIILTFNTQLLDFSPITYGRINLEVEYDGITASLGLDLSTVSGYGKVQIAPFTTQAETDALQASRYGIAIKRDYTNVGGPINIRTFAFGDGTIQLTAINGIFKNFSYTGNALVSIGAVINNSAQDAIKTFVTEPTGVGDCNTVQYSAVSATGGTPPYRFTNLGVNIFTGWDGTTPLNYNVTRLKPFTAQLYDADDVIISSKSINAPRQLQPSDFEARVQPYFTYSDLVIDRVVNRVGTDPLLYNLIDSEGGETGFQASNIFGGIAAGSYTVEVLDTFGCQISKDIVVTDVASPLEEGRVDWFDVSEYNSLSFYRAEEHSTQVRKTYDNTPSWEARVNLPKQAVYRFPIESIVKTQFRSSYPYHRVTVFRKGLAPLPVDLIMIQENLGVVERVDCNLFQVQQSFTGIDGGEVTINDGIGVYFDGGDEYEPNTSTVKGDSPYTSGLPGWAALGNFVDIAGIGFKEIVETDLFDETRGVSYFRIEGTVTEGPFIIQSQYDRHPYNVYRADFDMTDIPEGGAFMRIEPIYEEDGDYLVDVSNLHDSETFALLTDATNYLKIQWRGYKNVGKMLFTDKIQCEMWTKGRLTPISEGAAEFDDGDDRARSINQEEHLRMQAFLPLLTAKAWRKIGLVGALGNRGQVIIEDMEMIRIKPLEVDPQGDTNLSNITCEFAFSGETAATAAQDPVLSIDTGETISTPSTGKEPPEDWEANVNRLITEGGSWVKVTGNEGDYYVEI